MFMMAGDSNRCKPDVHIHRCIKMPLAPMFQTRNKQKPSEISRFQMVLVRDGRLELPTSCSQSKRATNCANPGFLVIEFCSRCGQTCGQAFFLTTSTCGGSVCIAGVLRDCGHGIFRLEGGATRSQSRRATNCANPGFLLL